MSVRKIAGLFAGFALAAAMIGSGVSAVFTSSVSAVEHVNVGTFACAISSTSPGAVVTGPQVDYTAPTITTSTGNAPFSFTVTSTGTIPALVTVTQPALSAPWSSMLTNGQAVILTQNQTRTYAAGLAWSGLTNADLGTSGSATWTVNCGELHPGGATIAFSSVGRHDGTVQDTITGTGFIPGPISVDVTYQFGGNEVIALGDYLGYIGGQPTADATGHLTVTFQDNCADGNGVVWSTDQTVTVTASDGTHSVIGTGTIVCSQK